MKNSSLPSCHVTYFGDTPKGLLYTLKADNLWRGTIPFSSPSSFLPLSGGGGGGEVGGDDKEDVREVVGVDAEEGEIDWPDVSFSAHNQQMVPLAE